MCYFGIENTAILNITEEIPDNLSKHQDKTRQDNGEQKYFEIILSLFQCFISHVTTAAGSWLRLKQVLS